VIATHEKVIQRNGPTKTLAQFIAALSYDDFDEVTLTKAKTHLLDTIGTCLAGSRQPEAEIAAATLFDVTPAGTIPVPGRTQRTDFLTAALLTGTAAHGLELDDGFRAAGAHPGVVVVPSAFAAGYHDDIDGKLLLTALVAGYEVMGRVGAVMHPRQRERGFHNTGLCGAFAAAAVLGVFRSLTAETLEHAFGIAASMASGINSYRQGGDVKSIHPGLAARNGLTAALLAKKGYLGAPNVLECKDGFFRSFAGNDARDNDKYDYTNVDILKAGGSINSPYVIADCYIKPYACGRHHHPALDGVIDIVTSENLKTEDVAKVNIKTYRAAAVLADVGWQDMATAHISLTFTIATALHYRQVLLEHFTATALKNPAVIAGCNKVSVEIDENLDRQFPVLRPAHIEIVTTDGRRFSRLVEEPLGSARNPLPEDTLMTKYLSLAGPVVGEKRATEIANQVMCLEELTDIRPFIDALAR